MTMAVQHAKPKNLASGEGDTQAMLTHTLVWKLAGNNTNGQYAMFEMIDATHGEAPLHSYPWEETFYILEGELEITLGNRQQVMTAGAVSHIPANAVHTFKVISSIACVLVIVSPAAAAGFYQEVGEKITSLPPDLMVFQAICAKYNLQLY
jgi:quercetin dioxygenase-like cupin family protein